jgi:hypothetical protein
MTTRTSGMNAIVTIRITPCTTHLAGEPSTQQIQVVTWDLYLPMGWCHITKFLPVMDGKRTINPCKGFICWINQCKGFICWINQCKGFICWHIVRNCELIFWGNFVDCFLIVFKLKSFFIGPCPHRDRGLSHWIQLLEVFTLLEPVSH